MAQVAEMGKLHKVTIGEVAREAGVSKQTVSRVLNDRPDVAPKTRKRVREVMDRLDYQPSQLAQSLSRRRSYTLGVVTAGLQYIGPSRTLYGITQEAEERGYAILLKELPGFQVQDFEPIIRSLLARHVDGIIWTVPEVGDNMAWILEHRTELPVPLLTLSTEAQPGSASVIIDNYLGAFRASQHLLDQGYRRIGHIAGPLDWWAARQRLAGWKDCLLEVGVAVDEQHRAEGNWSSASGEQAIRALLESYPDMDAVFVANDQMAISVYKVASEWSIKIPADLGLVGFDGIPEVAHLCPPLSTVWQDQPTHGRMGVSELVDLIETVKKGGDLPESRTVVLQPELIVRESSLYPGTLFGPTSPLEVADDVTLVR
ncbi:MAG: LacI family DNA-binding transcriptional regulator [Chloroflexota bacterium]|nr:LacI family DNA-binding transcriptional regulator [Chloroflexota bacterium]